MKKKFLALVTSALIVTSFLPVTAIACISNASIVSGSVSETSVTPRAHVIKYQYKVVNNVLYKRLYNYTLGIPLSDWVIA